MSETEDLTNEVSDDLEETDNTMDPPRRIRSWRRKFYAPDPAVFLLMVPASIFDTIVTNSVELQYCKAVLGINDEALCLNSSDPHFDDTQKFASQFSMARSCIELLIPCIFSFFLGPWSDTFGRKPLMLASTIGYFCTYALWTWGSSIGSLHPYYFLTFSVPAALSGGCIMFILASFCCICDITSLEKRASRMGQLQAFLFAGNFLGVIAAPYLISINYTFAYAVCAVCVYICMVYIFFFLAESVVISEHQRHAISRNPFQFKQLESLYETCYVKQAARTVITICLVILLVSFSFIQMFGEGSVFYMFLQHILNWTLLDYTPLNSYNILANAVSAYAGTWLLCKYFKLPDLLSLAIISFFRLWAAISLMFASRIWHVYFSRTVGSVGSVSGALIRVFLSRIVAPEDLGKVFSFIGSLEALTPLIGSLMYNSLYNATMSIYPRAVFFLSGVLCAAIAMVVAVIVEIHVEPSVSPISQTVSINA